MQWETWANLGYSLADSAGPCLPRYGARVFLNLPSENLFERLLKNGHYVSQSNLVTLADASAGEAQRQALNPWIRSSGAFDGVIDFDVALRDPSNPSYLLPAYVGDPLHPNDAGGYGQYGGSGCDHP
jgi:hypothetical protein